VVSKSVEDTEKFQAVEDFLRQLSITIKSLRFYPSNHPIPVQYLTRLHQELKSYLHKEPELEIKVSKTSLSLGSTPVGEGVKIFSELARDFYIRKLAKIIFRSGVETTELADFLSVLKMDPEEIRDGGGIEEIVSWKNISHIVVKQFAIEVDRAINVAEDMQHWMTEFFTNLSDYASVSPDDDTTLDFQANKLLDTLKRISQFAEEKYQGQDDFLENCVTSGLLNLNEPLRAKLLDVAEKSFRGKKSAEFLTTQIEKLRLETPQRKAKVKEELSPELEELVSRVAHIGAEELKVVEAAKERINRFDIEEEALNTLLEMLNEGIKSGKISKTIETLGTNIVFYIEEERLPLALKALKALRALETSSTQTEILDQVKEVLRKVGRMESVQRLLTALLLAETQEKSEYARACLDSLNGFAISSLLEILAEEPDMRNRKIVCAILVDLGKGNLEPLFERLTDNRWYLVRNIVFILGQIKDRRALGYFRETVNHRDPRVRYETVKVLGLFKEKEAIDILTLTLKDSENRIRENAIRVLGNMRAEESVPALISVLRRRDFFYKDTDAKIAAIVALGQIGSTKALRTLNKMARKKSLFHRAKSAALRQAARLALEEMKKAQSA
jgi:HEAT repeat protein